MRILNSADYYCIKYSFFVSRINLIENQKRKPPRYCSGSYWYLWSNSTVRYGHPFDLLLEFIGVNTERQIGYLGDPKLNFLTVATLRKF
jgi:hypothetical protein